MAEHQPKESANDYYVYVYIDPRNYEEFYYGKGKGYRKDAHLKDSSDCEKVERILEIRKEGVEPIIRVIAKQLTESQAFLIEKTLLWKLGKWTTNKSPGHFSKHFRPQDTLHKDLYGFDYEHQLYYFACGENEAKNWDDFRKFGYISGGWGPRYRDSMTGFNPGDIIAAHLKRYGFVGIGRILSQAQMIRDVRIEEKRLLDLPLTSSVPNHDINDDEQCEYVCLVKWIKSVPREHAKWLPKSGLYTTPIVRASLENQTTTIDFLEKEFGVDFKKLLR
ncbi:MAG: LEM-3-like GIY-YIG domain-containing protein [Pirellula sp.]|jgi:hypothetical protein